MSNTDYITLKEAARIHRCTYYALWCAVKRKSLKAVTRNDVICTTLGWLMEYKKHRRDKELRSRYNGMKTFDEKKGEYCVKRAAEQMGMKRMDVYNAIYAGLLKTTRKGTYHIITQDNIAEYFNTIETVVTKIIA